MGNKIIDSADPGIVIKETTVQLSDEKLRNLLSHVYEKAQMNASAIKLYKFYDIYLSIAVTLLISLLTSSFRPIGVISAENITLIAWFFCILFALASLISLLYMVNKKPHNDTSERDSAVEEELKKYL